MRGLDSSRLCELAIFASKRAGGEIMKHYGAREFEKKSDDSPLTKADIASHKAIVEVLGEAPFPILSEEAITPWGERKAWDTFWLIDPLDGTKDFLAQNGQFVVSIALIFKNRPILGVLFAPASDTLYYALKGEGAYKNGQKIVPSAKNLDVALASVHHSNEACERFFAQHNFCYKSVGSALKFGILSEGGAGIYPRFEGSSTWDIAAGDLILEESGGIVLEFASKERLNYHKESVRNGHFIAFSAPLLEKGIAHYIS